MWYSLVVNGGVTMEILFRILGIPIVILYWFVDVIIFTILCTLSFEPLKSIECFGCLKDLLIDWLKYGVNGIS